MLKNLENINHWFKKVAQFIVRLRILILTLFILLNIFAIMGLQKIKTVTSIEDWLLEDDPVKLATEQFEEIFGNNDFIALLIEANDVFSPQILKMMKELDQELEKKVPYADKVISLADLEFSRAEGDDIIIDDLVPDEVPDDPAAIEAIRRQAFSKKYLVNRFFTEDQKQTWVLLRLEKFPDDWEEKQLKEPNMEVGNALLKIIQSQLPPVVDKDEFLQTIWNPLTTKADQDFIRQNYIFDAQHNQYRLKEIEKKSGAHFIANAIHAIQYKLNKMEQEKKLTEIAANIQYKYRKYNIKATGVPLVAAEEMLYFENEAGLILVLGVAVAIILLIIMLRSLRGLATTLLTMISSILIVYGMMGHLGIKIQSVLMTIPVFLGMAVSIGYSIHILNFFKRNFVKTGQRKESIYYAVSQTGWSIFFTALTTVASLLSFYFIKLSPVRWLGLTSAAIIFTVYMIVMIITPILQSFGKDKRLNMSRQAKKPIWSDQYFIRLGKWIIRHSLPIVIIFAVFMVTLIYFATRLDINVDIEHSYGLKVPYIARMHYITNTEIGSWGGYDVTVHFNESDWAKDPQVLKKFEKLEEMVKESSFTKRTDSILNIIKDMYQLLNEGDEAYYRIPDEKNLVAQLLMLYEFSGGNEAKTWINNDYSMLRLMVQVSGMNANQINEDLIRIRALSRELFPGAEIGISGSLPQLSSVNKYVAYGQIQSFMAALVVIMILMMLVFKSIKTGLIGMIPNITPALVVGGLLGLTGIPLDFYTVTLIPMILGLAVDDTIHFITHCKLEYQRTGNYQEGILITFKTVGKALLMTSSILVASFMIYMISDAKVFFNLGLFIVLGISSALISDYLITPVLINWVKPFGKEKKINADSMSTK